MIDQQSFCRLKKIYTVNELLFVFILKNHWICFFLKFVLQVKQTKTDLQNYFHPSSLNHLILYMCTCNAERQKKSANSSHFKEDDSALPLQEASRLFWENSIESFWQNSLFFVSSFLLSLNILKKNSFHKLNDLASSAVCKKPFSIVNSTVYTVPKIIWITACNSSLSQLHGADATAFIPLHLF